ncbi:branched-chain amino acid transport system II carrier protein [Finegoldia sp. P3-F-LR]|uniref:branched-chain amino acid transport system II carrier protein n=1 Tax=unclassified Finegoldia TaxID=2619637 RepID=UPI0012B016B6|nr:branched-chain amino acid transport system II carrier protein [Finegoldia sp. BIOML-A1]MSB10363.1 branched-chain amino acid transport system II carrier protein [Finegoldia sp. BIOML-A1]
MNKKFKDVIIVGFALFAIFFGAGNLIFPPYLGVLSGTEYKKAMLGFLLTDPVLPILGVIITAKLGGGAEDLGKRVGNKFAKILGTVTILTIGPLFAIPRTAATTHEVFVSKVFPGTPEWVTALIFFMLTAIFVFNETGVIDKIGKYLTPGLVIILLVIIGKCIVDPIGVMNIATENQIFLKGFAEGYQTMDALGAALMTGIVVSDLKRKGYVNDEERLKLVKWVGLVAFVLLAIIYGGLIYVGATASKIYTVQNTRVDILLGTVQNILGSAGKIAIGIAVSLACLTTSVGLSAIAGDFFSNITKDKLGYKPIVLATVVISGVLSLVGVEALIKAAVPILSTVYPIIMVLIFLGIFEKYIKYDLIYTGAVLATFVVSFVEVLNQNFKILQGFTDAIKTLPLSSVGFEWLLPAIVMGAVFGVIAYIQDKKKLA